MEGHQPASVDLLRDFLNNPVHSYNISLCLHALFMALNTSSNASSFTDQDFDFNVTSKYQNCLSRVIPSNILKAPFVLNWWQQFMWCIPFAAMIIASTIGNAVVVWIIVAHKRMRTITNIFLLNLAVADFFLASVNAVFNFAFMLNSHWPFGDKFCAINNFVANLTVSTSVFTILAMSIDRFFAVVLPLRPRVAKHKTSCIIITVIWLLGCLLSFPSAAYSTTITYTYADGGKRTVCFLFWPDGPSVGSLSDHVYNIVFLVLTYVIPMSSMAVTYTWMGCVLWGSKAIGESSDRQNQVIKSKQKVVHMLIIVALLFAVCWLPYHCYFLYTYYHQDVINTDYIQHIYLAIYWLAMSNSSYNPIVYYFMNARFRSYFRRVLCFCKEKPNSTQQQDPFSWFRWMATITGSSRSRSTRVTLNDTESLRHFNQDSSLRMSTHAHFPCCEV